MDIAKKYKKLMRFLRWMTGFILLAISGYFWVYYLEQYYTGIDREEGSLLYFFIDAWSVWLFPLTLCWITMFLWKKKRINGLRSHVVLVEQERINQKLQLADLQAEIHLLNEHINKQDTDAYKNENYNLLMAEYSALTEDYHQSKEFIEKLLDKLNSIKGI